MIIYDELYNLIISGRLKIPPYSLLRDELINLQRKFTPPSGFSVMPKREGDVLTDDIADSLAGACYNAISFTTTRLPYSHTVELGNISGSNQRLWQSMSGPLGYGTGQQVQSRLEQRSQYFRFKK